MSCLSSRQEENVLDFFLAFAHEPWLLLVTTDLYVKTRMLHSLFSLCRGLVVFVVRNHPALILFFSPAINKHGEIIKRIE